MLAILLLATLGVAAPPQDDMAAFYGNTLVIVDDGIEARFHYRPDHTFTGIVPQYHYDLMGSWSQKPDGTICRVFDPPVPRVRNPDCGPMLVHAPGERKVLANGDSQTLVEGIK